MPDASTDLAGQVDRARTPAQRPVSMELERAKPAIQAALPQGFPGGADRFMRLVLTALRTAPDLTKCTPISVIGAAMQAAQLGLTPGVLGEAWIIPYKRGQNYEATFQIGWKGLVVLASRAGMQVMGATVHQGDEFEYELGLSPKLVHRPAFGDARGESIYWYAVVRHMDTGQLVSFAVLDKSMVERRRKVSRSPDSPAWSNWYDEMALSKAAREALRFCPMSVEMGTAFATEETVRTVIDQAVDDQVGAFDESPAE